jgi:NADH:ubiquinone oxidoreductase subunit C
MNNYSYFIFLHIRLSTLNYLTQMVDVFCYELPLRQGSNKALSPILVYNFQNIQTGDRNLLFLLRTSATTKIKSLVELFPNTNWLEREVGELYGLIFDGKNDTRNLMLQYGDTSAPFKKSFPAIGLKELYYNFTTDLITQTPFYSQI